MNEVKFFYAFVGSMFLIAVIAISCHNSDVVNPKTGPGTSYPCGVWGVVCPDQECCPWNHVCGDSKAYGRFNRCPDGYCCYDGVEPLYGASPDGGATTAPASSVKKRSPR